MKITGKQKYKAEDGKFIKYYMKNMDKLINVDSILAELSALLVVLSWRVSWIQFVLKGSHCAEAGEGNMFWQIIIYSLRCIANDLVC